MSTLETGPGLVWPAIANKAVDAKSGEAGHCAAGPYVTGHHGKKPVVETVGRRGQRAPVPSDINLGELRGSSVLWFTPGKAHAVPLASSIHWHG